VHLYGSFEAPVGADAITVVVGPEAWRTHCPKLPVWEDAMDRGLIFLGVVQGINIVRATPAGLALLEQHRRSKL